MLRFCVIQLLLVVLACCSCVRSSAGPEESNQPMSGPYVSKGLDRDMLSSREVLEAMSRVPRHQFVPEYYRDEAYEDRALPIGSEQTISQPFMVALMTQEARVTQGSRVLEIGTGSGYQAAVLAEIGAKVFTIEIIDDLALQAESLLSSLGYDSVTVRSGDGWQGWKEEAPFDAIIVTAATPEIPPPLLDQLAHRGRLVIPVRSANTAGENLMVIERDGDNFTSQNLGPVRFVPMTGDSAEKKDLP